MASATRSVIDIPSRGPRLRCWAPRGRRRPGTPARRRRRLRSSFDPPPRPMMQRSTREAVRPPPGPAPALRAFGALDLGRHQPELDRTPPPAGHRDDVVQGRPVRPGDDRYAFGEERKGAFSGVSNRPSFFSAALTRSRASCCRPIPTSGGGPRPRCRSSPRLSKRRSPQGVDLCPSRAGARLQVVLVFHIAQRTELRRIFSEEIPMTASVDSERGYFALDPDLSGGSARRLGGGGRRAPRY